jgi:hypothetical protein
MFRAATSEPPTLRKTKDYWSYTLHDFLSKCFTAEPEKRPTAEELLDEPFIRMASRDSVGSRVASVFLNEMFTDASMVKGRRRNASVNNTANAMTAFGISLQNFTQSTEDCIGYHCLLCRPLISGLQSRQ